MAVGFSLEYGSILAISDADSLPLMGVIMSVTRRVGRRNVKSLRSTLSERDLSILASAEQFRFLSRGQIEQLHFADHASRKTAMRTTRAVLARLTRDRLLERIDGRSVGGLYGGSTGFIYGLGPAGGRVLHESDGRWRRSEPSRLFLDHTLAVAELATDLRVAERERGFQVLDIQSEPHCWREFGKGLSGTEILKPDLYIALAFGEWETHWFVEVDRATHSSAAVLRKCRIYQDYWASGQEQERTGVFPRALWVTPGKRRAALLERALGGSAHLRRELFQITDEEHSLSLMTEMGT